MSEPFVLHSCEGLVCIWSCSRVANAVHHLALGLGVRGCRAIGGTGGQYLRARRHPAYPTPPVSTPDGGAWPTHTIQNFPGLLGSSRTLGPIRHATRHPGYSFGGDSIV
jgi:hypothetical protein